MFSLIKIGVGAAGILAVYSSGFLAYIVAGIVLFHVALAARDMGAGAAAIAYALPASVAALGVAALHSQRFDFMTSMGVAVGCGVAYLLLRPKRVRRTALSPEIKAAIEKMVTQDLLQRPKHDRSSALSPETKAAVEKMVTQAYK